jgi:hypothetical protein
VAGSRARGTACRDAVLAGTRRAGGRHEPATYKCPPLSATRVRLLFLSPVAPLTSPGKALPRHSTGRGGRFHWPPASRSPAPSLPCPTPQTKPLAPLGPSPALPRPNPGEPRRNLATPRWPLLPGATLQRSFSFRGPPCKSATPIVKVSWLILVNCVENHRKIIKM